MFRPEGGNSDWKSDGEKLCVYVHGGVGKGGGGEGKGGAGERAEMVEEVCRQCVWNMEGDKRGVL